MSTISQPTKQLGRGKLAADERLEYLLKHGTNTAANVTTNYGSKYSVITLARSLAQECFKVAVQRVNPDVFDWNALDPTRA